MPVSDPSIVGSHQPSRTPGPVRTLVFVARIGLLVVWISLIPIIFITMFPMLRLAFFDTDFRTLLAAIRFPTFIVATTIVFLVACTVVKAADWQRIRTLTRLAFLKACVECGYPDQTCGARCAECGASPVLHVRLAPHSDRNALGALLQPREIWHYVSELRPSKVWLAASALRKLEPSDEIFRTLWGLAFAMFCLPSVALVIFSLVMASDLFALSPAIPGVPVALMFTSLVGMLTLRHYETCQEIRQEA